VKAADGKIMFGEWLPDLADLDNPGLTEAKNVVFTDSAYRPFNTLLGAGNALGSRPLGALEAQSSSGTKFLYAGRTQSLWRQNVVLGTWTDVSSGSYSASTEAWEFARFEELIIATNYFNNPEVATLGSGSFATLATSGTAPKARRIGQIGRFILLGDTNDATNGVVPYRVQWCAIDDPRNWPTPGTAGAITVQAGEQFLNSQWGPVKAIVGGDQFGLIMQRAGLTRVTYVGGNLVFQFDEIEESVGVFFPNSVVRAGDFWYYLSDAGICATDGVRSYRIGEGKVNRYFYLNFDITNPERIYGAIDARRKLIYWCHPTTLAGTPTRILIFNYETKRFSWAEQTCEVLFTAINPAQTEYSEIKGFTSSFTAGSFTGAPGSAVLTTAEIEFHPGLYTHVQGFKPHVTASDAATPQHPTSVTVAIGTRETQDDAVTYTSETTPTARTGFADFRSEARYVRARTTINQASGQEFGRAIGGEYQIVPGGAT
jgi:hypothetical protein